MFRRRRRNRGVWMPTVAGAPPTFLQSAANGAGSFTVAVEFGSMFFDNIDAGGASAFNLGYIPMSAIVGPGSSYLIKRIVGHVDVAAMQTSGFDSHGLAGFGLFVDRVDAVGNLANIAAWPLFSSDTSAGLGAAAAAAMQKRWIFRRIWHLGNASGLATGGADPVTPPYSGSWHGGGIYTSSHIDSKVKARVSVEERLWWTFQVTGLSPGVANLTPFGAGITKNLRIFATPTMYRNR